MAINIIRHVDTGEILYKDNAKKWAITVENALKEKIDLKRADLSQLNLDGVNLRRSNLRYACLRRTSLRGADLRNCDLRYADLCFANLQGALLAKADILFSYVAGTNFNDTDITSKQLMCRTVDQQVKQPPKKNLKYFFSWWGKKLKFW